MSNKIKNKQLVVTSDFDFLNNKLINLASPSASTDGVNKEYVDTTSINSAMQTGLYSGGTITLSGTSHFNISSGIGYFVDVLTKSITKLEWDNKTYIPIMSYGPTDITISIGIDSNGNVFQQVPLFSETQRQTYIILGQIFIHPTLRILVDVAYIPIYSRDIPTVVDTFVTNNDKNIEGNVISPNGINMMLNASTGKMLGYSINSKQDPLSPNISNQISLTGISYFPTFYNGTEWIYNGNTNTMDPSTWSNGTLPLQSSTNNKFNLRVLFRSNGIGDIFFLCYPIQTSEYGSITDAEADILQIAIPQPPELFGITIPICWIIVKGNATDLSSSTDAKIVPIKSVSTASGSVANNASDVSYDNTTTTNLTSTNVQDALDEINDKIENLDFNSNNIDMIANSGTSGIYLATNITVSQTPRTRIRVEINSIEVSVGNGSTNAFCFFSSDGGVTPKTYSNVALGDSLYWNKNVAPYNLETSDTISFIYMTY